MNEKKQTSSEIVNELNKEIAKHQEELIVFYDKYYIALLQNLKAQNISRKLSIRQDKLGSLHGDYKLYAYSNFISSQIDSLNKRLITFKRFQKTLELLIKSKTERVRLFSSLAILQKVHKIGEGYVYV